MKSMSTDNQILANLIENLMKTEKPIWKKVAYELAKPRKKRVHVNISKIQEYGDEENVVLVPGKVLGAGALSKKLTVAAFSFSQTAQTLISNAGGKAITIDDLQKSNPDGRGVLIIK